VHLMHAILIHYSIFHIDLIMKHFYCIAFVLLTLYLPAIGQTVPVAGYVFDQQTNTALAGVSVGLKESGHGTTTDSSGKFIVNAQPGKSVLLVSFVGYEQQELPVTSGTDFRIGIKKVSTQFEEVVVIGYGTQQQKRVTGSISTINAKQLEDQPVGQFAQKLQGRLPGVQIIQGTGQPGEGMAIRIRGAASINAGNNPLYVVDGFPLVGNINNINPNEIESFSVLKGSAATALYGSRAANGVVLITTKIAKQGQTVVHLNASTGLTQVPQKGRAKLMNAKEFLQFEKEIYEDKARYEAYTGGVPELFQNPEGWTGPDTDWYDVITRKGQIQDYNLTISSGKDKFSSATTVGYYKEKGSILNTDYERLSLRSNNEYRVNDAIKLGFNIAPTYQTNQNFNTDGNGLMIYQALSTPPIFDPFEKTTDGSLPITFAGPGLFTQPNWYRVFTESRNRTKGIRLLSNAYGEYSFLKHFRFRSAISMDLGSSNRKEWNPSTVGSTLSLPPKRATAAYATQTYYSWLTENTLHFENTFGGDHHIDVLAGYSAQQFRQENSLLSGTDFPDDVVSWIDAAATKSGSSNSTEWSLLSLVGRVNYDYKGKYLLSAAVRRDGSSRFGPDNRWGVFPSVSAGWILSEEKFIRDISAISFLKIRGEYGHTGNFNIGDYNQYGNVVSSNYVLNGQLVQGRSPNSIGNSTLTWETTKGFDLGVDIGLLKNRLSFAVDYYNKRTTNMLYQIDIPNGAGFSNIQSNVGEFKFWGVEFSGTSRNFVGDFRWTTDFNISFNRNQVIALGTNNTPIGGVGEQGETSYWKTEVGHPLGLFYGYVFEGVYKNQEDFDKSAKNITSAVGSTKMKDINGDGVINSLDKEYIGNPNPDFVYGLNNTFGYKNVDLNIVISGSYGGDIFAFRGWNNILEGIVNVQEDVKDRWRSDEQPGAGLHATTKTGTPAFGRYTSSKWVHNGSFLTVKNITLGYTFKNVGPWIRSARLFASVQQPFIISKYQYGNPEASMKGLNGLQLGLDGSAYPVPRTYALGVDIDF
jgi:TonB-linked SusC/RagA family outer membrane protein